jgi:hypothetical protein
VVAPGDVAGPALLRQAHVALQDAELAEGLVHGQGHDLDAVARPPVSGHLRQELPQVGQRRLHHRVVPARPDPGLHLGLPPVGVRPYPHSGRAHVLDQVAGVAGVDVLVGVAVHPHRTAPGGERRVHQVHNQGLAAARLPENEHRHRP